MKSLSYLKSMALGGASVAVLVTGALADQFNIPSGDLKAALHAYSSQTGVPLIASDEAVKDARTRGAKGELTAEIALSHILAGTGFVARREANAIAIVQGAPVHEMTEVAPIKVAAAAGIESVVVTSSKIKGDIQTVPIAITALSQEQLTSRQIAGGPDLVKEVPNLTFTKTNFSGYSIQIRGIGTQAISVSTDPAVAVALNDIPFIRNHFFEQEFYDVNQVEVLRGPQGTLYGRNATAGVVNVITAKPTDQFEAMLSADWGNYLNRRYEGMVNIPVVDDRFDIRVAGEWTKRNGYTFNTLANKPTDGRDLWSSRVSIGFKPVENLQTMLVWEHFSENDDRLRSSKQLCETDTPPAAIDGVLLPPVGNHLQGDAYDPVGFVSQGCKPTSLYSPSAFEVPYGFALPYVITGKLSGAINSSLNPYAKTTQSTNLRDIETTVNPRYVAKNDVVEFNADYAVTPTLTFTSQTGFNQDFLWSNEDYNRFDTSPGLFVPIPPGGGLRPTTLIQPDGHYTCSSTGNYVDSVAACAGQGTATPSGYFCDPQVGCANRLVAQDLSDEHAWQLSQEFRFASNFSGPFNFSVGGNYLHYETEENYYVFINTLTLYTLISTGGGLNDLPYVPGVTDNHECLYSYGYGFQPLDPRVHHSEPEVNQCNYIDPNPIQSVNNKGHNYFLSQNPYVLNSYAGFGEAYYNVTPDIKLTGGLRWTDDQKHFIDIPSEVVTDGWGYVSTGTVDQQWNQWTGRAAANWTPKLDFTEQTLVYASYAHGYKAGGANPPGAALLSGVTQGGEIAFPDHPLTFKPEFIDAYELGSKNTLLDGGLTLNGDVFFYNYKGYQISRIVDRTAINDNFDATVKGAELEAMWEPTPGLKFNFAGGYEDTRIDDGQSSVDLMDRADAANHPDWMVLKPFPTQASNCILPIYVVAAVLSEGDAYLAQACGVAYDSGLDPATLSPYAPGPNLHSCSNCSILGQPLVNPPASYIGFDTASAPNNGEGFSKNLGGNQLPNAPHFTTSLSAEYTLPVSEDWAATLHSDFYWQSQSFARVFNDVPYDKIRGYSNVNLALILTSASGWQVLGYLKNVFDTTAITGDFLNSDDSGLTTNVFLTDPRLYGVRITKNF